MMVLCLERRYYFIKKVPLVLNFFTERKRLIFLDYGIKLQNPLEFFGIGFISYKAKTALFALMTCVSQDVPIGG